MKLIFFGSDDFAAAHLQALFKAGFDIPACVTQPDRAKGRGMKDLSSPVKDLAQAEGLEVLQPGDLQDTDFFNTLKNFEADVFVVIAYGKILTQKLLDIPKLGAFNVHGSLLPKYRGAAPINWAVINGETETGLSVIRMNAQMDAGDVFTQLVIPIKRMDTSQTLREAMMKSGPGFLIKTLEEIKNNKVKSVKQDEKKASLAPKLNKQAGHINWAKSAREIHHLVRGLLPWPVAYTYFKDKRLKIFKTKVIEGRHVNGNPGEVVETGKQGLVVETCENHLLIKEVQLESSRRMDAGSFLRGHNIREGFIFQ